jgi:predicted aspartyl protease
VFNDSTLELLGRVDYLRRPIIRLILVGLEHEALALVDTGCNMYMVTTQSIAKQAGLTKTGIEEGGELAAGDATFDLYNGTIRWFGKERNIIIHVPAKETIRRPERDDNPKIIIGTKLLRFSHLAIAFHDKDSFGSVRIHRLPTSEDE